VALRVRRPPPETAFIDTRTGPSMRDDVGRGLGSSDVLEGRIIATTQEELLAAQHGAAVTLWRNTPKQTR
jgi:hypothetical protein